MPLITRNNTQGWFQKNPVMSRVWPGAFLAAAGIMFVAVQVVFATPPGSAYAPGETLDPSCLPGDTNCTVMELTVSTSTNDFGIGTTTPYAKLSVEGNSSLGNSALAGYFIATSTTATSTFAGGVKITGGGLAVSTLTSCSGNYALTTDASGNIVCGAVNGAIGAGYDWQQLSNNFGVNALTPTTTIPIWIKSTATSTYAGDIQLSQLAATKYVETPFINATSTTATSTFAGGVNISGAGINLSSSGGIYQNNQKFLLSDRLSTNTSLGYQAMNSTNGPGGGSGNSAFGNQALAANTIGYRNSGFGYLALGSNVGGTDNSAFGYSALASNISGSNNVAVGNYALQISSSGQHNVAVGYQALELNTAANNTTAIGYLSANGAVGSSNQNGTFLGYETAFSLATGGDNNTFVGYQAGRSVTSGNTNLIIGYNADAPSATGNQQMNIGNLIYGTGIYSGSSVSSNPASGGMVGIGTTTPMASLTIEKVLTSATPLISIVSSSTGAGTTTAFYVSNYGKVGISTSDPIEQLDVRTQNNGDLSAAGFKTSDFVNGTTGSALYLGFGLATGDTYSSIKAFKAGGSVASNLVLQAAGGNVGVNQVSPTYKFDVSGLGHFSGLVDAANFVATSTATSTFAGGVGIATTTPASPFSVAQSSDTSQGGIFISSKGANSRAIYMDGSGVMNFYGGSNGTWNDATLNAAGAWTNASDIAYKEDIADLGTHYSLATVLKLQPRYYVMKGIGLPQIGFIAQEMQQTVPEVVSGSAGHLGIEYGNLEALSVKGIQDLAAVLDIETTGNIGMATASGTAAFTSVRLDDIEKRIAALEASSTSASTSPDLASTAMAQALSFLQTLGVNITNGIVYLNDLVAQKITASQVTADTISARQICLDDVCITKTDLLHMLESSGTTPTGNGVASSTSTSGGSATSTAPTASTTADTIAPTITVQGNNPATIQKGTPYVDLGATVTDNVDTNLGLRYFVDGIRADTVTIDTSVAGTHTIDYVATDNAGNTATSTRTVIVTDPPSSQTGTSASTTPSSNTTPVSAATSTATSTAAQ